MEPELKQMFEIKGSEMSVPPTLSPQMNKRIGRQRIVMGGLVAATAFALVSGGLAVTRALSTDAAPALPAGPAPAAPGTLAYALDGDIYTADEDGSNPVKIADGRSAENCYGWGGEYWAEGSMWSPDGRYLAYRRHTDCGWSEEPLPRDVVISDTEGNVLTTFPAQGWDIAWSPDSTRLAVWDAYFPPAFKIGVYGLDGRRQTQITMPSGWQPSGDHDPAWAPDGSSLILEEMEIPLDGGDLQQREWGGDRVSPDAASTASFSPDGSQMAYSTNRSLMVVGSDGSTREVFAGRAGDLTWSRAGDRIAFVTHTESQDFKLRLVDVATRSVTLVAAGEQEGRLGLIGFSPRDDRILFSWTDDAEEAKSSLRSINVDGTGERLLARGTSQGQWR